MSGRPPFGKSSGNISVRIARTPDEYAMAMAIRAAVFLGEEDEITYQDEFDGNDQVATHLIAFVGDDPAGVIRIRWFADFARYERLGVRRRYRSYKLLKTLVRAAMELSRQKGYRIASGKARGDAVVRFWERQGGHVCGEPELMHRGTLVPIFLPIPHSASQPTISASLLGNHAFEVMLSDPEGGWNFHALAQSPRPVVHMAAE